MNLKDLKSFCLCQNVGEAQWESVLCSWTAGRENTKKHYTAPSALVISVAMVAKQQRSSLMRCLQQA